MMAIFYLVYFKYNKPKKLFETYFILRVKIFFFPLAFHFYSNSYNRYTISLIVNY